MPQTIASGLQTPQPYPSLPEHVMDLFSLKGKVASVTGSSSGIGYEVAVAYAQAGADVALWYNSNTTTEAKAEELSKKYGVKVKAYKCDITDRQSVTNTINQIKTDFGKIDVMVANAGVPWTKGPLCESGTEGDAEWDKVMNTDFYGVYYVAKLIGSIFKEQGNGSFIITASMSGHIANVPQLQACYNAAKSGMIHFARSLAVEWAGFARVNSISPGYIDTEIAKFVDADMKSKWHTYTPMGREGLPKELVGGYLYLASDASTFTTGADLRIDGGYTVI